jgi:4-hydroxy-4-methyl-2-oxoglutarate aldolase
MPPEITKDILTRLAEFDSCSIADAIETSAVRLRNEGFNDPTIRCFFPQFAPMIGFAFTFKVRSSEPPMKPDFYLDRIPLAHLVASNVPKVIVIEDMDSKPGRGALVGKTQVRILKALGCAGVITNGAIRGVKQFQKLRMPAFARNLSVSHAYVHLVATETPVNIAGVHINPGDLIHGDANGIVNVPLELASRIPEVAEKLRAREVEVDRFCESEGFSLAELGKVVQNGRFHR